MTSLPNNVSSPRVIVPSDSVGQERTCSEGRGIEKVRFAISRVFLLVYPPTTSKKPIPHVLCIKVYHIIMSKSLLLLVLTRSSTKSFGHMLSHPCPPFSPMLQALLRLQCVSKQETVPGIRGLEIRRKGRWLWHASVSRFGTLRILHHGLE